MINFLLTYLISVLYLKCKYPYCTHSVRNWFWFIYELYLPY